MTRMFAYESDPYRKQLSVRLIETGTDEAGPFALVDDTVLYPGGGGQPPDRGTLAGVPVMDTSIEDDVVRLGLERPVTVMDTSIEDDVVRLGLERPVTAEEADLVLDWDLRFDRMQQHTAQHLLTAVAVDRFGWDTTSFHLGDVMCDIELNTPTVSTSDIRGLEAAVMKRVRDALPVRARRVPREEYGTMEVRSRGLPDGHPFDVRLVEIEGVDLTTCGGTHVACTSEIETICLLDAEAARGGTCTRVRWLAGKRVRERLLQHEDRNRRLRQALGVGDEELVDTARVRGDRIKSAERRIRHLETALAEEAASSLINEAGPLVHAHFDDVEPSFVQFVARAFAGSEAIAVALLTGHGSKGSFFVVVGGGGFTGDVQAVGVQVGEALEARGGGSGSFFQGKPASLTELGRAIEAAKSELAKQP